VSVRDLGQAHLKDVQHEHVYELSLDEAQADFPPLNVTEKASGDTLEERFEQRINRYVEDQLEAAFSKALPEKGSGKKRGCLLTLVAVAAVLTVIALLVQLAF
jgi:hypothetical protein